MLDFQFIALWKDKSNGPGKKNQKVFKHSVKASKCKHLT